MVVKKLDVVTQVCPFPLIEAKAAMAELATEAIPQWAAEEGYTVTDYQQSGDAAWTITVQK